MGGLIPALNLQMITLGKHSYMIDPIRIFDSHHGEISVGNYTSIGQNVVAFMGKDHKITNLSTFPFGHPRVSITKLMKPPLPTRADINSGDRLKLTIGNDVWIGHNVVIFGGITIGDGAVIGAFSIVTKDVNPYEVVVGQSRVIKKRFSDEVIKELLEMRWWDWEDEKVASVANILCSPDLEALKKHG